jgi:uncharacterized protein CbrC (UPF0167 family)
MSGEARQMSDIGGALICGFTEDVISPWCIADGDSRKRV